MADLGMRGAIWPLLAVNSEIQAEVLREYRRLVTWTLLIHPRQHILTAPRLMGMNAIPLIHAFYQKGKGLIDAIPFGITDKLTLQINLWMLETITSNDLVDFQKAIKQLFQEIRGRGQRTRVVVTVKGNILDMFGEESLEVKELEFGLDCEGTRKALDANKHWKNILGLMDTGQRFLKLIEDCQC